MKQKQYNNYIIKYKENEVIKIVEKFKKELIIYYSRNRFINVRKRVIIKLTNGKYKVITHYIENGIYKTFVSKIEFNEEQIEELIQSYLDEFNFEKTLYYR